MSDLLGVPVSEPDCITGDQSALSLRLELSQLSTQRTFDSPDSPPPQIPARMVDRHNREWLRSTRKLGAGAFGEVFLGVDSNDGALVAVKSLRVPRVRRDPSPSGRAKGRRQKASPRWADGVTPEEAQKKIDDLVREVEILSKHGAHPNIVNYRASLVVAEQAIVIMEFVAGGSLADLLADVGRLPLGACRRYTKNTVAGLAHLHRHQIVHRDLKPGNLLLTAEGAVKLADFGAAVHLRLAHGESIGTPLYMSPELCLGLGVTPISDVWSVGIVVLELLTNAVPWKFSTAAPFNPHTFMYKLGKDPACVPVVSQEVPEKAAAFALKCLQRQSFQRPTACELMQDPFLTEQQQVQAPHLLTRRMGAGCATAAAALCGRTRSGALGPSADIDGDASPKGRSHSARVVRTDADEPFPPPIPSGTAFLSPDVQVRVSTVSSTGSSAVPAVRAAEIEVSPQRQTAITANSSDA
eukprot:TRINITY_DN2491_c0_g2_i1.p1 TRINITY_DN2491_c0_g2~~TRINITY_DN2491_c0_g2_i1.p1  ORF type:complete len:468 (+),score=41.18 TRINITY_DN2491_c0_g2_i1:77-1480(+)